MLTIKPILAIGEQESHIISDIEPSFCPICAQAAAAIIINEDEDEDDI